MNQRYNPQVDDYFARGCGRCALFETPQCRVHQWQEEMQTLRDILLDAGLTEERKWGNPCYTLNGKNVVMMGALKEFCSIGFFKGSLLTDPKKILIAAGENTQAWGAAFVLMMLVLLMNILVRVATRRTGGNSR
jgi:uncharacterized protein YdeI (YjbR/CyaY-like superfamily)